MPKVVKPFVKVVDKGARVVLGSSAILAAFGMPVLAGVGSMAVIGGSIITGGVGLVMLNESLPEKFALLDRI